MSNKPVKALFTLNYLIVAVFAVLWLGVLTNQISVPLDWLYGSFVIYCATFWAADKLYIKPTLKYTKKPIWLELNSGIFWLVLAVLVLRSSFMEMVWVPTGSMLPTIQLGDLLYVSKSAYTLKAPFIGVTLATSEVKRGDVVVFKYPPNPSIAYVKRVIAVPGDTVSYNRLSKKLTLNGIVQPKIPGAIPIAEMKNLEKSQIYQMHLDSSKFFIAEVPSTAREIEFKPTYGKDSCVATTASVSCVVPEGYFFTLGDNRDNSVDSRYWGLARIEDIAGKAKFVLLSKILGHIGWLK